MQSLVDDAVAKGARLLAGGKLPDSRSTSGQFYPPTVLADVRRDMRIAEEEVFGPVLCVTAFDRDEDAVRMANDCPFGLGGNVFSRSRARAERIAKALECGMVAVNDFATTYMAQSLPFGGVKESGFDKFAGIEGLRGCCNTKAVVVDRVPWLMRTDIPPPLQYPVSTAAFPFCSGAWAGEADTAPRQRVESPVGRRLLAGGREGSCGVAGGGRGPRTSQRARARFAPAPPAAPPSPLSPSIPLNQSVVALRIPACPPPCRRAHLDVLRVHVGPEGARARERAQGARVGREGEERVGACGEGRAASRRRQAPGAAGVMMSQNDIVVPPPHDTGCLAAVRR